MVALFEVVSGRSKISAGQWKEICLLGLQHVENQLVILKIKWIFWRAELI